MEMTTLVTTTSLTLLFWVRYAVILVAPWPSISLFLTAHSNLLAHWAENA